MAGRFQNVPVEKESLERHLGRYARRNTSDFFIHKNLKGFLEGELDFYLKNEVLDIDDLERRGPELSASWFETMRVVKDIGREIVAFLAQIEDFQKKLFEKKKFVVSCEYCLTLDRVPEDLYPEIVENDPQYEEWECLFAISEIPETLENGGDPRNIGWLKANPQLVLDTKHFSENFKDRLLASIEDLDEKTDGLLINSENFQALNLLQERYRERAKTVAIDPPYNRNGNDFPYKDSYKHSSWLSMMKDRVSLASLLLRADGALFSNIDENERDNLQAVLDSTFGRENRIEELIWVQNTTHSQSPLYSTNHEYIEVYASDRETVERDPEMFREPKPGYAEVTALVSEMNPSYPPVAEIERAIRKLFAQHIEDYKSELAESGLVYDEETKKQDPWRGIYNYSHAEYRDGEGRLVPESEAREKRAKIWVWREDNPSAPARKQAESTRDPNDPNYRFYRPLHPKTGKPCPHPKTGWRWPYSWPDDSRDSFESLARAGRIVWGEDETKIPQYKRFLHEVESNVAKSVFHDYIDGEKQIAALFGETGLFPTPKPTTLPTRFIAQTSDQSSLTLDFFAGSGTTGHAVIDLNREDGGRRKYILVEMGEYFDTVLKPRIQKVIYSKDWKDGKPKSRDTGVSHIFKYMTLESYEDALNNIAFTNKKEGQEAMKLYGDDYLLRYMLDFETQGSASLLNVGKMYSPFGYTLVIREDGESRPRVVDLPETFAYLLGMRIKTRKVYHDGDRRYLLYRGPTPERDDVAVIWRDTGGWSKEDYERDRVFVGEQKMAEGAQDVFVNGDSLIPEARPLEATFKRLMMSEQG